MRVTSNGTPLSIIFQTTCKGEFHTLNIYYYPKDRCLRLVIQDGNDEQIMEACFDEDVMFDADNIIMEHFNDVFSYVEALKDKIQSLIDTLRRGALPEGGV